MGRVLHNVKVGVFAFTYGLIGLMIGASSGFIVTKIIGNVADVSGDFSGHMEVAVAAWAILLAALAIAAYLRSSTGGPN